MLKTIQILFCTIAAVTLSLVGVHAESVRVIDTDGNPVAGAWVSVVSESPALKANSAPIYLDQRAIAFDPIALGVPLGTRILFRNSDTVTHHIFSFSPSAPTGLEYVVRPREETTPTEFNQPGVVRLGCNIHDQMVSHVYIAPSNEVLQTDAQGLVAIKGGSDETKTLEIWTPEMGLNPSRASVTISKAKIVDVKISINAATEPEPRRSRRRRY